MKIHKYNVGFPQKIKLLNALPSSFRKKLGKDTLHICVHPCYSDSYYFDKNGNTNIKASSGMHPAITYQNYQKFIDGELKKSLSSLPVYALLVEYTAYNSTISHLETFSQNAEILVIFSNKKVPTPLLSPQQERVKKTFFSSLEHPEKVWEKLVETRYLLFPDKDKTSAVINPLFRGALGVKEEENIRKIARNAAYGKLAEFLKANNVNKIIGCGELGFSVKGIDSTYSKWGCVWDFVDGISLFIQAELNEKLIFPGFDYYWEWDGQI